LSSDLGEDATSITKSIQKEQVPLAKMLRYPQLADIDYMAATTALECSARGKVD
jgi:hypothetical protein